ncbi:nitroreductase/quinone reductase family protein [Rhodococcus erythropolis]|nr:nitroreductase/quinone reductase family protein [Rhodococcus erythropolis]MDV6275148.1 nitroreductase/quinone reductase family protein [Rhodococcus erythropolis]
MADPTAIATVKGVEIPVGATLAEGATRRKLWTLATTAWPPYETYADRAFGRQIRVFRLHPVK